MRRLGLIALAALAGCGGGPKDRPATPKVTKQERAEQQRVHKRLKKSSLPKDMQRELEEAQRELDESN